MEMKLWLINERKIAIQQTSLLHQILMNWAKIPVKSTVSEKTKIN